MKKIFVGLIFAIIGYSLGYLLLIILTAPASGYQNQEPLKYQIYNEMAIDQNQIDHKTPGYLRQNDRRSSMGYFDLNGQKYVSMVDANDYDASYDGKTWFHLLGRICLKTLPEEKSKDCIK